MRLTTNQIEGIILALAPFAAPPAELRLYGSRVRDDLKGGDIDLLLIVETEVAANTFLENKHILLSAIKKNIGDQKIDLTIAFQKQVAQDAFLQMVFPKSIILHQW
jgi:predicted nucleotidyltransferase